MATKSAAQQLLELPADATDLRFAVLLADKCIALTDTPFRFAINHDIRPPKNLACPLPYDWTRKDRVGVEFKMKLTTHRWLTRAFLLGYTVYQMDASRKPVGFPHSIEIARRRAANHQRLKDVDDDTIPF